MTIIFGSVVLLNVLMAMWLIVHPATAIPFLVTIIYQFRDDDE